MRGRRREKRSRDPSGALGMTRGDCGRRREGEIPIRQAQGRLSGDLGMTMVGVRYLG